ncbi:hypothetical protein HPB47_004506 [Ixodes persulcatus]|uniref:Uncharacterized protein n=1 Tax=Ixodes persulcatus TaxID=34615 RepID=A0AC60PFJ5_IXOPE|nr:hypothetical protein HPB47_004506 [Ixodes persulcatus]
MRRPTQSGIVRDSFAVHVPVPKEAAVDEAAEHAHGTTVGNSGRRLSDGGLSETPKPPRLSSLPPSKASCPHASPFPLRLLPPSEK